MNLIQLFKIAILALVQGAAELLPVSSSAHVVVFKRLLGYQTNSDFEWAFLLVMLHTGTMFSVLLYFWSRWKPLFKYWPQLLGATIVTGGLGLGLVKGIEHFFLRGADGEKNGTIESLFQQLPLVAIALTAAGVVIIAAGTKEARSPGTIETLNWPHALITGVVQGICIPFRGFSRSGATISAEMFLGIQRMRAEEFSFALAVLLTPAVIGYEGLKLIRDHQESVKKLVTLQSSSPAEVAHSLAGDIGPLLMPGLFGMVFSFVAGLLALKLLSAWMERGHWRWFGYYCLVAAAVVLTLHYVLPMEIKPAATTTVTAPVESK